MYAHRRTLRDSRQKVKILSSSNVTKKTNSEEILMHYRNCSRRFLVLLFLMRQHLIGPWWMASSSLIFFRKVRRDIRARSLTFCRLSAESQTFPRIILRKGMPFWGTIVRKSKLSVDYTAERHVFPLYNPWKVGLIMIIISLRFSRKNDSKR